MPTPFALGAHPSPADHRDLIITDILRTAGPLPDRFVWSPLGPVLNQGNKPQCVAYAFAGMKNAQELRETGGPARPVFDEDWFYAECKRIDGIAGDGTTGRAACQVAQKLGYRTRGHTDEASWRIAAYYGVPLDWDVLRRALMEYGPIPISSAWFGNWFSNLLLPNRILPEPKGDPVGGHETLLIGWDARRLAGSPHVGHLIVRNSWGTANNGATNIAGNFYFPWDLFRAHIGWDAFKTVDVQGDVPGRKAPEPTPAPAPTPAKARFFFPWRATPK